MVIKACPYPHCQGRPSASENCPECGGWLKSCEACDAHNRRLARFCRQCGAALSESVLDWSGFRGGPDRQGLNRYRHPLSLAEIEMREVVSFSLGDPCVDLLFYEGFLLAISAGGAVVAHDLAGDGAETRAATHLALTAHPCAHWGALYLAGEGQLVALSLMSLAGPSPSLEESWSIPIKGIPTHALLALAGRLYLNVGDGARNHEIHCFDLEGTPRAQPVYAAQDLSFLVEGQPSKAQVLFLAERRGETVLGSLQHRGNGRPQLDEKVMTQLPGPLSSHIPLAVVGKKIFAVFGEDDQLCRLDSAQAAFDTTLRRHVNSFALSGLRDGIVVQADGVFFMQRNVLEEMTPVGAVVPNPVILRERFVVLGLRDGRIRLHDLQNPPFFLEKRLGSDVSEAVKAIASSRDYVAAGGHGGTVKLWRLLAKDDRGKPVDKGDRP